MNKKQLIQKIIHEAYIHHNISIDFNKMPDYEDNEIDWQDISEYITTQFIDEWQDMKINDTGNRNLCGCKDKKPENILKSGACKKHDIWHIYNYGRSSATLYWDKYWNESNTRGLYFESDEQDLQDMPMPELKTIYAEICKYNKIINSLMENFYLECEYRLKENRKEKDEDKKQEKLYAKLKKAIINNDFSKRICKELLEL